MIALYVHLSYNGTIYTLYVTYNATMVFLLVVKLLILFRNFERMDFYIYFDSGVKIGLRCHCLKLIKCTRLWEVKHEIKSSWNIRLVFMRSLAVPHYRPGGRKSLLVLPT